MTDSENPFVLLARITVKEGMVEEYLEIAEAADKAVEKIKYQIVSLPYLLNLVTLQPVLNNLCSQTLFT